MAMAVHWKGILSLLALLVITFAVAVVTHSIAAAIVVLLLGLCLGFVLPIAWMRPPGEPKERHERHDRFVNDMRP